MCISIPKSPRDEDMLVRQAMSTNVTTAMYYFLGELIEPFKGPNICSDSVAYMF